MNETFNVFGIGLDLQTDSVVEATCRQAGLNWVRHSMLETFTLRDDLAAVGVVVTPLPEQAETARVLLERLARRHSPAVVVFLTERLDLRTVFEALRAGAEEVLQWPHETDRLEATIQRAANVARHKMQRIVECREAQDKLDQLSTGEREVLELMLAGKVNKLVASRLGIALRTVENRRKQIFTKLGTRGFAEIVRMVQDADRLLRFDMPQLPEMTWAAKLERAS
jgi:FixJ family two-component response regulator